MFAGDGIRKSSFAMMSLGLHERTSASGSRDSRDDKARAMMMQSSLLAKVRAEIACTLLRVH
jgi:hypothetical protein